MARPASRTRPIIPVGWYLREWMDSLKVDQATMMRRANWSKTTASHLYNCRQNYNPALVQAAAAALHLRDFELFLHPDEAHQIRRLRLAVEEEGRLRAVAEARPDWPGAPLDAPPPEKQQRLRPR